MLLALLTVRNGEKFLEYWLNKTKFFVDGFIINNDASTDNTLEILNRLKQKCNILEIINSEIPIQHNFKNEFNDLNKTKYSNDIIVYSKLLEAGRKHGGTMFFRPSLDELLSSNFYKNGRNGFKSIVNNLKPGEGLFLKWNDVVDNQHNIRNDYYGQSMQQQFAWKDSLEVSYQNVVKFTNDGREYGILSIPILPDNCRRVLDYKYCMMHFQYISFSDTLIKQYHYKLQDGVLGKEGNRLTDPNYLNSTFDSFMLPLLDRETIKLDNKCFELYEDLDYTNFIGWQDYRLDLIRKILNENGFDKAQHISTWIPKNIPIKWGRNNWEHFYIKNWDDFVQYEIIINTVRQLEYESLVNK